MIIMILWCLMGLAIGIENAPYCGGIPWYKQLLLAIVFLAGGPFFVITKILEAILDCLLPEGWDDDENNRNY